MDMNVQNFAVFRTTARIVRPHRCAEVLGANAGTTPYRFKNSSLDRRQRQRFRNGGLAATRTRFGGAMGHDYAHFRQLPNRQLCGWPGNKPLS